MLISTIKEMLMPISKIRDADLSISLFSIQSSNTMVCESIESDENSENRGGEHGEHAASPAQPSGGQYELDAMLALMNLTAVTDISALPGAISRFERDLKLYEQRSGRPFSEEFKVPTFLKLLPRSHEHELKLKFAMGMTNYSELTAQVMGYS